MLNNWLFKPQMIKGIKVSAYGEPYESMVVIRLVNGQAHVESLISKSKITREDVLEVEQYLKHLGYDQYTYTRYRRGIPQIRVKALV